MAGRYDDDGYDDDGCDDDDDDDGDNDDGDDDGYDDDDDGTNRRVGIPSRGGFRVQPVPPCQFPVAGQNRYYER